jgi:hypothetical protein
MPIVGNVFRKMLVKAANHGHISGILHGFGCGLEV